MEKCYIDKEISNKVLMLGVYYKNNTPGGMASLITTYEKYFFKLKYIPTWRLSNRLVQLYYLIYSLCAFIFYMFFDKKIKLVHIHGAAYASFYRKRLFIALSSLWRKKIIYHMHAGEFDDFYSKSNKKDLIIKTINRVDKFVVLSKSWENYFINLGINKDKLLVLNNVVEPPLIINKKKEVKEIINVLFLGILVQAKGIYDLLDVIIENKNNFEGIFHFYIAGNGDSEIIVNKIRQYNLQGTVTFLGWLQGEKKVQILSNTDIFTLPSYFEGLPMSILETMSYGATIIATNVGGIPELVHSELNGILVEPGNKAEIANAFILIKNNRELLSYFGENSLCIIKEFYPDSVLIN